LLSQPLNDLEAYTHIAEKTEFFRLLREEAKELCRRDYDGSAEPFERNKVTTVSANEIIGFGSSSTF